MLLLFQGQRVTLLLGAGGTCLGSWLKVLSIPPEQFYIGFIGQTIIAIAQLFTVSSSAKIAATWFGKKEVGTACGLAVLGLQLGVAIGFLTTPLMVRDHENLLLIGQDLNNLFWLIAFCTTIAFLLVIVVFDKEPELPPSIAQALLRKNRNEAVVKSDTIQSYKRLLKNGPFMSLLFTYGTNVGVYCYLSALMNPIILAHFPVSAFNPVTDLEDV